MSPRTAILLLVVCVGCSDGLPNAAAASNTPLLIAVAVLTVCCVCQFIALGRRSRTIDSTKSEVEETVRERTHEIETARDYFEGVLDSLDAHVCILDRHGRLLSTNRAWQAFHAARSVDQAAYRRGADYLELCEAARFVCRPEGLDLADAISGVIVGATRSAVSEYRCDGPDGPRWFHATASPFVGEDGAAVVVTHVDITERVLAGEKLEEQSRRARSLARIIQESPNDIYIFRQSDLRFVEVNDGALAATGYSRTELLGLSPRELLAGFDERETLDGLNRLAAGEVTVINRQAEHRRKDGSVYPVQASLHAARFNDQPVFVAFVTDLTEIKGLERRLVQAQKLEALGQLAAGIAHEINTPMQCVATNVDFLESCHERLFQVVRALRQNIEKPGPRVDWKQRREELRRLVEETRLDYVIEEAPAAISEAAAAVGRVIEIVRATKAISHPGGRVAAETDINELVRDATILSRNHWKYSAELELDLDGALPRVEAHPAELSQVLINLLVNASDAIAERHAGGDESAAPAGEIIVRTSEGDGFVRIEVTDNGAGVPDELRERVFDPFFTTKDVGKGTGQGLAICYDVVVNRHGGTIELNSTEGRGATFVVCLPLIGSSDAPAPSAQLALSIDDVKTE